MSRSDAGWCHCREYLCAAQAKKENVEERAGRAEVGVCVCMCERETRGRGLADKSERGVGGVGGGEGGGGAKADSREGKLRRGAVEQSEKRQRRRRQGWKIRWLPFESLGYKVLGLHRSNWRALECCGEEVEGG